MNIRSARLSLFLSLALATVIRAEPAAGLRDVAARIDYGWYTADIGLIHAARDALDASGGEPWGRYVRAYAAYRAARLALATGAAADADLEICAADAAAAAGSDALAVEASVLVVACAALAASAEPLRAVWHQRRLRQGLAQAESLGPGNPRLLLVSQVHLGDGSVPAEVIVAAFREDRARTEFPDWGEAEALLLHGERRLAAGDLRGARDALDETLLIAPDYTAALELKARISALTAGVSSTL